MSAVLLQQLMAQAVQHHQSGELEEAKSLYLRILKLQPENPDALHLFGLACHQLGDHETAVQYIRRAVVQVPAQPVLRNNLGDALHKAGDLSGAAEQLRKALELRQDYAGAHMNLGSVLADAGEHAGAHEHASEATRLDPERAEAWFNLGMLQLDHVMLSESVASFRIALALRPEYAGAANSLLYVLNLLPGADPAEVADEHVRVAAGLFGNLRRSTRWPESPGRVRIGYVSGDFCAHAVNCFFEPILEHHDATRFETFCYSDVAKPDQTTARLRNLARHWREISGMDDKAVSELIEADKIDILVDLAGYTKHCRLGVFARKPARCQISYLGYPNTTGLAAMDYRVVDCFTAPRDELLPGTESLLRMPDAFACFRAPAHASTVKPAPALENGYITFGCLHKLEKLNATVVETWSEIMRQNPGSRLLIARDQLDEWQQQRLQREFAHHGVAAARLDLIHLSDPTRSFFEIYSRMDILLDVFPWSGHTIACCALWSGVPVVSLRGDTHAGRMVGSVLHGLGLGELIAEDRQSYVAKAGDLCSDPDRLARLRAGLRGRMECSPLRDEPGFVRTFESRCQSILVAA